MNRNVDYIISSVVFDVNSFLPDIGKGKILFVLFDAGETKALEPVMHEMERVGINYQILAFSTAWGLMKTHPKIIDIYSKCSLPKELNAASWNRIDGVDDKSIQDIYNCISAEIIVAGMVSEIQKQLINIYKKNGADIFLYYDSFAPLIAHQFTNEMVSSASLILVPSADIVESVRAIIPYAKVDVVGQPTLEHWIEEIGRVDAFELKKELMLSDDRPFLVYISGYGEGYAESFEMFVKAIQHVNHYYIGVSLHPKMDGEVERKILLEHNCKHVFLIPKHYLTSHIVSVADLVVTWRSTVGEQAAFLGKPIIYLDNQPATYSSLAIEKQWALQCTNVADFLNILLNFEIQDVSSQERFLEGGVPRDSAKLILKKITKRKDRSFKYRKLLKSEMSSVFIKTLKH